MATVGRANGASITNTARLSYYSTEVFANRFFTYSTSLNNKLETIGTLTQVSGANSSTCPAGRVLRENGRKLYPGANPGITTYMVGVYDATSLLSGFIDPNAKVFQIYNTDKPNFLADGVDPTGGLTDRGPSVYTRGNITAEGDLDITGDGLIRGDLGVVGSVDISGGLTVYSGETIRTGNLTVTLGNIAATAGAITAGKQIRSTTLTNLGTVNTNQEINCALGQVFKMTITGTINITAINYPVGTVVYIIITSTGNFNVDFNVDFRTVNNGVRNVNTTTATFSFVSDGTALWQIAEANGLTA
jgi:hypothetical protein